MLKSIVHSILSSPGELISMKVDELMKLPRETFGQSGYIPDLLTRLQEEYGRSVREGNVILQDSRCLMIKQDPGTLIALFTMNYLKLDPGDAIYVPADCIHAYLSGDIIECMARSNNMLNAGFSPAENRDAVDLFVSALSFQSHSDSELLLPRKPWEHAKNGKTTVLAPPLSEFKLLVLQVKQEQNEEWPALGGPAILVVTSGTGRMIASSENFELREGFVFFIAHDTGVKFLAKTTINAYAAFVD
jgi:mannose-6-phosphate isomerase